MTTGRREITSAEFAEVIHEFQHTAFRLEQQPTYLEDVEADLLAAFLRGEPRSANSVPELRQWFDQIAEHVRQGRRIERVRIQRTPPTDYQRFERSMDPENIAAGEVMRYLTWERAHEVGLLPEAGRDDWWLLDSSKLVIMRFDDQGRRIGHVLVTDPTAVAKACEWRDLAVHHSVPADARTRSST
jgi:hypothetical protein